MRGIIFRHYRSLRQFTKHEKWRLEIFVEFFRNTRVVGLRLVLSGSDQFHSAQRWHRQLPETSGNVRDESTEPY